MGELLKFVGIIDAILSLIGIGAILFGIYIWYRGIGVPVYRLGNGLARRKVYVLANEGNARSVSELLINSRLFQKNNIIKITTREDFGRAEGKSLYVVRFEDWSDNLDEILGLKKNGAFMVVFAPDIRIPDEYMDKIKIHSNIAITNFRGRLIGDVLLAMMTTSFNGINPN